MPDGTPTQPNNAEPYCVTRIGAPGTIEPAGPELQFEGDGAYTVKVSIGAGTGDGDDCLAGPSRSGSFSVGVLVAPVLVGEPMTFRLKPAARPRRSWASRPRRRPAASPTSVHARRARRAAGRRAVRAGVGGRLPAPRRLVVHRARHRRGARRQPRHRRLRHAVVGAARGRRAHRLPPRQGPHLAREDQAAAADVRRRVARSGRRRERERQALARRRLQGQAVQAPQHQALSAGASARSRCG